jgi:peroxiredoxin
MNKRLIQYILLSVFAFASCKNNTCVISGTLVNPANGEYLYLDELKSDNLITVDSFKVSEDGSFKFSRKIESPSLYLLKVNNDNFLTMLLNPGDKMKINSYFDSLNYPINVSGSEGTELMARYNKELRKTINKIKGLSTIYNQNIDNPDLPKVINSLDSLAQVYLSEINTYTKDYIDNNLESLVSLVALYQQVAPGVYVLNPARDMKYFTKVDSTMTARYPDYEPAITLHKQVQELIEGMKNMTQATPVSITGAEAPEIALPNPKGDTIRLSSTRGSIVLLDFWASWCVPCRQENPNLVKTYDMFHRKGFQIYQVSLDKTKDAWLKGIQDDNLGKWIHVSDILYWNSTVVQLYKIESIPNNYLLDREGRIIATNLRGDELEKKLTELFN